MADGPSQDGRIGSLATPLGKDTLVLGRLDAFEGLGELFEYRIEALSTEANIDFNSLIGLNLSVHLETVDQAGRDFSGVLVEARWIGKRGALYIYRLVLRPWLWLLSHTSDCRIFSSMKTPDIIVKVFQDRGFTDFRNATTGSYPTLEYCVQYRESDMNFVCRLMEEYGIYYFFEHEKGGGGSPTKHTLVLADSKSCHKPTPSLASAPYLPLTGLVRRDKQQFDDWSTYRGFQSGRFVLNDYDYEKPGANLVADADHSGGYARGSMEMYDYPGRYDDQGEGKTLAKVRLEADQAKDQRRSAVGYAPSLLPGFTVTRTSDVGPASEDIEYLVLRCTHSYGYQTYESTATSGGGDAIYVGTYELASSDRAFRSPLLTRKSIIQGPQTAKVVGQGEIDVDKEGRIQVQFYWDRKKIASRRVRVGQIWAGKYQKSLFIPRVGDEVIVQFLEGDPDRPLVVGSVFNADNVPPTTLPDNKTKSGINSESSTGHSGYNHFIFDDNAGQETVKLRAQKDLIIHALNNETRNIDQDQNETIGGNETITVGGPTGGGNFTLNAVQTATINVGPSGSPMTQVLMDTSSITLNVGPSGMAAQIVMNMTGITLSVGPSGTLAQIVMGPMGVTVSGTPMSQLMVQPMGISTMTPMMNLVAEGPITFVSPMVTIPMVTIGAGTASGLPLI
jgi:type VI secretion system secreted protein VgrG